MTDIGEFDESMRTPRRKATRGRLIALLMALLLAATAMVAFSAGSASAQTQNDNGDSNQQQADDTAAEGTDESDGSDDACDRDGTRRGTKLGRFGMGDTLTEVLGIDAETLREKLKEGSTLADIAAEQGVEVADVVEALVTAISEKAAEHDREIDTERLTAMITAFVNGERPEGDDRRHGRRGLHHGGKGIFGSADAA